MSDLPLGWISFDERTDDQHKVHNDIVAKMPSFGLIGDTPAVGTKILLTDSWKHPKVIAALGREYPGIHQVTGSCVAAGGGNVVNTLNFIEVCSNREPEKLALWFWLYNYGKSRQRAGMRGRGEGSFGSTFAESVSKDGNVDIEAEGLNLPKPSFDGQLVWSQSVEMQWSDGAAAPSSVVQAAKPQTIYAAPLVDGYQVRDSIINGYPCTRASTQFVNPGTAQVKNSALVGSYNGRGGHQESWLGYWNHPQLGELIWEQNQWGANAYGKDPGGGPAGGCWIRLDDVDKMCKRQDAEVYAFSQFAGYPAQPDVFDWLNQSFFS